MSDNLTLKDSVLPMLTQSQTNHTDYFVAASAQHLLDTIKTAANARDVPYQSLIKVWLQEKVGSC